MPGELVYIKYVYFFSLYIYLKEEKEEEEDEEEEVGDDITPVVLFAAAMQAEPTA